ncbi:site-2 protease family protein [soil metagenome]
MKGQSISAGRYFGIEVMLHYSWFVIFFLVATSFIARVIPAGFPELTLIETVIIGLAATVLLFLSVVAHEFAHSLYAKSKGLEIDRITLFIFGGAAEIKEDPKTPGQEFIMAAVGPLTSLVIAFGFGILLAVGISNGLTYLVAVSSILAAINFILAIFNLLPGFPMDGGRMLRATIWKLTNNLIKATRIAAGTGKLFAYLLMTYGLIQFITAGALGGIWLVLIGLFLNHVASMSYQQTLIKLLLKDVRVADLMNREYVAVPEQTRARDFLRKYVLRYKQTSLPVKTGDGKAAGIINADDVPESGLDITVKELAHDRNYTLGPDDEAMKALEAITRSGLQQLPVAKNGTLVGTLTIENLNSYINGKAKLSRAGKAPSITAE